MNCHSCGKKIPEARLKAVPSTRVCLTCKAAGEEVLVTAYSPCVQRALVESAAITGDQERATEVGR